MKNGKKILIVLTVIFLVIIGSSFGLSNSFLSGTKAIKYTPDRECDESIDVPERVVICTGGWETRGGYHDEPSYSICKEACDFLPTVSARKACKAACHANFWIREWEVCRKYEEIIIYPCDNTL